MAGQPRNCETWRLVITRSRAFSRAIRVTQLQMKMGRPDLAIPLGRAMTTKAMIPNWARTL